MVRFSKKAAQKAAFLFLDIDSGFNLCYTLNKLGLGKGMSNPNLIGTKRASDLLGITQQGVQWLLKNERLKGSKVGRDWLIDMEDLLAYKAEKEAREKSRKKKDQEE